MRVKQKPYALNGTPHATMRVICVHGPFPNQLHDPSLSHQERVFVKNSGIYL